MGYRPYSPSREISSHHRTKWRRKIHADQNCTWNHPKRGRHGGNIRKILRRESQTCWVRSATNQCRLGLSHEFSGCGDDGNLWLTRLGETTRQSPARTGNGLSLKSRYDRLCIQADQSTERRATATCISRPRTCTES